MGRLAGMTREPVKGAGRGERTQGLVLDRVQRLAEKGLDQHGAGRRFGNAAGSQEEKGVGVQFARRRAMAAFHVVGENL